MRTSTGQLSVKSRAETARRRSLSARVTVACQWKHSSGRQKRILSDNDSDECRPLSPWRFYCATNCERSAGRMACYDLSVCLSVCLHICPDDSLSHSYERRARQKRTRKWRNEKNKLAKLRSSFDWRRTTCIPQSFIVVLMETETRKIKKTIKHWQDSGDSAETPSSVHWRRIYFQLTHVHSALDLFGRCALQIYLLTLTIAPQPSAVRKNRSILAQVEQNIPFPVLFLYISHSSLTLQDSRIHLFHSPSPRLSPYVPPIVIDSL